MEVLRLCVDDIDDWYFEDVVDELIDEGYNETYWDYDGDGDMDFDDFDVNGNNSLDAGVDYSPMGFIVKFYGNEIFILMRFAKNKFMYNIPIWKQTDR